MNEDAQPNERQLNKKGGTIPAIRSAQASRCRGTFQRSGHSTTRTRYYHKPLNNPPTGTYPFVTSHNHQHYPNPSKRPQHAHDGPYTKRRRTDHDSHTESHSRHEPADASFIPLHKPPNKPRKSAKRKAQAEPIELLVDLPPHCRKGAPDCQRLRKEWQRVQVEELSAKTGVPLQFGGYTHDGARFILDDNSCCRSRENSERPKREKRVPAQPTIQRVSSQNPDSMSTNVDDGIIIVENVDDLGDIKDSLLPFSPIQREHDFNLQYPSPLEIAESARLKTPEPLEPLRVFTSGVLTLAFLEIEGESITFDALPSATKPAPSLLPSGDADRAHGSSSTDDASSLVLGLPGLAEESFAGLHSEIAFNINQTPLTSALSIQPWFNREVESLESSGAAEPFSRCKLVSEAASIQFPLLQSDKIRRIMHVDMSSVLTVSMRGSVSLADIAPLRHRHTPKMWKVGQSVDDACLLWAGDEYITVVTHARDQDQLSWCRSRLGASQNEAQPLPRPWNTAKKGGVSAVASMMQPLQFATGGYDHIVHLWEVKSDLSSASPQPLTIKHTSQVHALLAIRDTSHKLMSAGADCNVHVWDLSSERVVNTLRPSNAPYHLHPTTSPFCTLLEVAHRELQFEVRDHRLVPKSPVMRFGYNTDKVHGRFIKGATSSDLFACGSRDGNVRLWDLRNVKLAPVTAMTHQGQKIVQVVFQQSSHLIVCSEGGRTSLVRYDRY